MIIMIDDNDDDDDDDDNYNTDNDNNSCIYSVHISIQRMCKALYIIIPRSLDTISRPHLQRTISTPQGAFLAELPIMELQAST